MSNSRLPVLDIAAADPHGLPVVVGVPFPRGMVTDLSQICVCDANDEPRPTAAKAHVTWPDGSPRWVLLQFLATSTGRHVVQVDRTPPAPQQPVSVTQVGARTVIDNGLLQVTLAADGPSPVPSVVAHGEPIIDGDNAFRLSVDEHSSAHEQERNVTILHDNPMRARVRIEGAHYDAKENRKVSYRLDVEVWAGWATMRTDYHFINEEPGADFLPVNRIALECDYTLNSQTQRTFQQINYSDFYTPRRVTNPDTVAMVSDASRGPVHVEDEAMLLDDWEYAYYLGAPLVNVQPWLGVTDGSRNVYMTMQHMQQMRPKRLSSDGANLILEVWPSREGTLDLRQGRSRRSVITQCFADATDRDAAWINSNLNAPIADSRATVDATWLAHCAEFDQHRMMDYRQNARLEKHMSRLMRLTFTERMFDYGDTPDTGYSGTYIPLGGRVPRQAGAPEMEIFYVEGHGASPWSNTKLFEPVWTNNEYDAVYAFCTELMRTGKEAYWPTIRNLVRHNYEVDFVHYSDHRWIHRATPQHSCDHVTSGAIPSHFWTQGLLAYYCLSGDDDALEFAVALGDKIIENFYDPEQREVLWGFTRELGWPVLALSHLVDITGEARFEKLLGELIEFLSNFDLQTSKTINLSGVNPRNSFLGQMAGSFFGYASMIEGIDHYLARCPNEKLEQWFIDMLRGLCVEIERAHKQGDVLSPTHMHNVCMSIGYERTGDDHFLKVGMVSLQEHMESSVWQSPAGEVKSVAMIHRNLARFLGHAHRAGLLDELEFHFLKK